MGKNELSLFIRELKKLYPRGSFDPKEWWDTFKDFNANALTIGLEEWRRSPKGAFAPSVQEIRDLDCVGRLDPNGIFLKSIMKNNQIAQDAVEEMRL